MSAREDALRALAETNWSDVVVVERTVPAKVVVSARVDPDDAVVLEAEARRRGIKPSVVLRDIVAEWAAGQRGDGAAPVTISPAALHAALDQALRAGRGA
jgi:hypothetical protein